MNQQMDKQLPEGWVETVLGNLCEWGSGGTPSRKVSEYYDGNIPWVKTGDLGEKRLMQASEFITQLGLEKSSARIFPKNSVAIAMYGATIGKVSILGIDAATNQACAVGTPLATITTTEFLYYFLLSQKDIFIEKGKGGAQPNISQIIIKTHTVLLPPLAEQHYLADKLDSLLTRIQTLSDQLAAVPALLKQFRQSVLADAVSGKLTAGWREENQEAFPQMVTIAEVADFSIKKQKLDDDLPVSFSSMHYMSEKTGAALGFEEKKWGEVKKGFTYFENNDVLLAKITPCFENGKTAVARNLINGIGTGSTEFMVMRPNEGLLPDYLLFNINTNNFRRDGATNMTGSVGHKRVPKDFVENWPILLPSLAEQTEIVRRVETLFALADNIEQQSRAAAERVALLTQSVLAKAFRGELSEQWRREHPDLISGDNSAAALLARIQAERAATGKKSRRA